MNFQSLPGLTPYVEAQELQKELVEKRVKGLIPDTILFLEHTPVVTQGRGLQWTGKDRARHMPLPKLPEGVDFCESERGGDLTYHGPGQLVVYPICLLDGKGFGPDHDVTGFLRKLEGVLTDELRAAGMETEARENATGVWTRSNQNDPYKKVASIGIAVRKWVTYHGIAINVVNDLEPFRWFSPCGFESEVMARLKDFSAFSETSSSQFQPKPWRENLEDRLKKRFLTGASK